jgi:uncharacterized protein (DUF2062 family)
MDKMKQLLHEFQSDLITTGQKVSVGFAGAFGAMSINDIAGLIVAVLTGIYMCFQIDAAWRKRKEALAKEKELEHEHKG